VIHRDEKRPRPGASRWGASLEDQAVALENPRLSSTRTVAELIAGTTLDRAEARLPRRSEEGRRGRGSRQVRSGGKVFGRTNSEGFWT